MLENLKEFADYLTCLLGEREADEPFASNEDLEFFLHVVMELFEHGSQYWGEDLVVWGSHIEFHMWSMLSGHF